MESATVYTLERLHWQFFGTLTFKSARLPERRRLYMWLKLRSDVAKWFKVPRKALVWALRQEAGEITSRLHFHFLIAGLPENSVKVSTCMAIKSHWETLGGGMARVREYCPDAADSAAEYITKCLGVSESASANGYEVGKFTLASDSMLLSENIWDGSALRRVSLIAA